MTRNAGVRAVVTGQSPLGWNIRDENGKADFLDDGQTYQEGQVIQVEYRKGGASFVKTLPYQEVGSISHPSVEGVRGLLRLTHSTEEAFRAGGKVFAKQGADLTDLVYIWEFDSPESEIKYLAELLRGKELVENIALSKAILSKIKDIKVDADYFKKLERLQRAIVLDYEKLSKKEASLSSIQDDRLNIQVETEKLKQRQHKVKSDLEKISLELKEKGSELETKRKELEKRLQELEALRAPLREAEKAVNRDWWRSATPFETEEEALGHALLTLKNRAGPGQVLALHLALKHAPFTVLTGPSGAGKTSLVLAYADAVGIEKTLIAVQPNWTGVHSLHGYVNPLHPEAYQGTPFSEALRYQIEYTESKELHAPLDLVLLDEINLSYVEYFLADYLSAFETEERRVQLVTADEASQLDKNKYGWIARTHGRITAPRSFLIAGTANEDHTTRPFSDKFRDRSAFLQVAPPNIAFALQADTEQAGLGQSAKPLQYVTRTAWQEWCRAVEPTKSQRDKVIELARKIQDMGLPTSVRLFHRLLYIYTDAERLQERLGQEVKALDLAVAITAAPKYSHWLASHGVSGKDKRNRLLKAFEDLGLSLSQRSLEDI